MRVVEVYSVSKRFGNRFVVKDVSFSVDEAECVGIIGLNGAGKTTLISVVVGLLLPTSGDVKIFGRPPRSFGVRGKIGYLPELFIPPVRLTPFELLGLFCKLLEIDENRVNELLRLVSLYDVRDRLILRLSKGMRQRLGIALSLVGDPPIVVLDEPFTGLDPLGRYDMRETIRRLKGRGKTIIFNSHVLQDVREIAGRVILMHDGTVLYDGSTADFVSTVSDKNLEDAFLMRIGGRG